jgi:hypothetical protein|tara:strand:- start:774 stop:1067 length:294 start_codon:yes stop_codon:yes gene_type:complete
MANPTNLRTDIYVDMTSGNHYALLDGEVCSVEARATKFSDRYNYTTGYVQEGVVINSKWKVIDSGRKAWLFGILSDAAASRVFRETKPAIAAWISVP